MPSDVCSSKFVLHLLLLHCKLNSELMVSPKNIVGVNDDKFLCSSGYRVEPPSYQPRVTRFTV